MYFNSSAFGNYEVELLRAGEVADAGVGDVGGLVRRDHIVPHAHLGFGPPRLSRLWGRSRPPLCRNRRELQTA